MEFINFQSIVDRIMELIKNDPRQINDLASYLGHSRQCVYDWKHHHNPTLKDLFKISKYYGVPLEYIISGEESSIDDVTAAFIASIHDLTEEQKKEVFASVREKVERLRNN